MAIINDNDMEIVIKGNQKETVCELIRNRLYCLIQMPACKPEKCCSKYSSSTFVNFMSGMVRTFAIRDEGSETKYEECEYYLSVYYKRGKDDDTRKIFDHRIERKIDQSIAATSPSKDELISMLSGKELVLITNYMQYGNMEALKVKDFLDDILFLRKDCGSKFIRRDENCDIRVYLSQINDEEDFTKHRLCAKNVNDLDIGYRIVSMLKKKCRAYYDGRYYSMEFGTQSEEIQALYFITRFHSNEQWEADPVNIVAARISTYILPETVPRGERDENLKKNKTTKGKNGEQYIIDAIHFNSDILYDLTELGKYVDLYFGDFMFD